MRLTNRILVDRMAVLMHCAVRWLLLLALVLALGGCQSKKLGETEKGHIRTAAAGEPGLEFAEYAGALDADTGRLVENPDEDSTGAPVDRGDPRQAGQAPRAAVGNPAFRAGGSWSRPIPWPEIPMHGALTPDGRLMTYGSDANGVQGALFHYSIWDPRSGEHLVLPNGTSTDIFCSAQILLPGTGDLLLAGGDIRGRRIPDGYGGVRENWGVNDVNRFRVGERLLVPGSPMRFARWYGSVLTLPDGRLFVSGGIDENGDAVDKPEIYEANGTWRTLEGIELNELYPRTFLAPTGRIVAIIGDRLKLIDAAGDGSIELAARLPDPTNWMMPAVEYDVGKLMLIRGNGGVSLVDVNDPTPTLTETMEVSKRRQWSSLTLLADGQVLLTGGGIDNRGGNDASLAAAIWNPRSGTWTEAASAGKTREYHSTALLLPDASVLVAGGGAPGPVLQLNGEVFYPPYLYGAAGQLAPRPRIVSAPATLTPGTKPFELAMASAEQVARVTFVRTGSVTHSFNFDQGFVSLAHAQAGSFVSVDVNRPSTVLKPGYYMLFVFNADGVPSESHIVRVNPRLS